MSLFEHRVALNPLDFIVSHFLMVKMAMKWWYVQVHTRISTTLQFQHHFPSICVASQQRSHLGWHIPCGNLTVCCYGRLPTYRWCSYGVDWKEPLYPIPCVSPFSFYFQHFSTGSAHRSNCFGPDGCRTGPSW